MGRNVEVRYDDEEEVFEEELNREEMEVGIM